LRQTSLAVEDEDGIIAAVKATERGDKAGTALNERVASYFAKQSAAYASAGGAALSDPLLYGNYDVSFVSSGNEQRGNPAGGGYRGGLGKLLFDSRGVYQHIVKATDDADDRPIVINYIVGKAFKAFFLSVILRGRAQALTEEQRKALGASLGPSTVKAEFEPPLLGVSLDVNKPPLFSLRVGPPSSVVLDTPSVTPKVRLGRGSRGSLFVFTRCPQDDPADASDAYKRVLLDERGPLKGRRVGLALSVLGACAARLAWTSLSKAVSATAMAKSALIDAAMRAAFGLAGLVSLLGLAAPSFFVGLFLLFSKGGILDD